MRPGRMSFVFVSLRAAAMLTAIAALAGCQSTPTRPLDSARLPTLAGQTIVLAERPPADLALNSAIKSAPAALLGPLGGALNYSAAVSRGKEIERSEQIQDPA